MVCSVGVPWQWKTTGRRPPSRCGSSLTEASPTSAQSLAATRHVAGRVFEERAHDARVLGSTTSCCAKNPCGSRCRRRMEMPTQPTSSRTARWTRGLAAFPGPRARARLRPCRRTRCPGDGSIRRGAVVHVSEVRGDAVGDRSVRAPKRAVPESTVRVSSAHLTGTPKARPGAVPSASRTPEQSRVAQIRTVAPVCTLTDGARGSLDGEEARSRRG